MPRVHFPKLGRSKDIRAGATILAAANAVDAPIGQSCNGDGICGWCKVTVVEGMDGLFPPSALETKLLEEKQFQPHERAACLAKIKGDVTVTTTYW
jgi:ferredoxin, 2Fe-2S